jgi:hypothetical protein
MKKLDRYLGRIFRAAFFDKDEQHLLAVLKRRGLPQGSGLVLVQIIEDCSFLQRFIFFLHAWSAKRGEGSKVHWIWPLIPFRKNRSLRSYLLGENLWQRLSRRKWTRFYLALGGQVVFSPERSPSAPSDVVSALQEKALVRSGLLALEYKSIALGDLINDTYLRYRHRPTVDLADPFLRELIEWAVRLVDGFEQLFRDVRYDCFVTSYTSYIHHGISARVAMKFNVPVFAVGISNQLLVRVEPEFPFHKRNFHHYKGWFAALPEEKKSEALRIGHAALEKRLKGATDTAISYMKRSAYLVDPDFDIQSILPVKSKPTVLVMGHDFFDSPHIYGQVLFPDFYLWLDTVLVELGKWDCEVIVKPHPNGLNGNEEVFREFSRRFPTVHFISPRVSALQLAERGVELVLTVYGTVAHELAYVGLPVLCAGENPHSSFSFCETVLDLASYLEKLRQPQLVRRPEPRADEIAQFFYVHNFRTLNGETDLFPFGTTFLQAIANLDCSDEEFRKKMQFWLGGLERVNKI